MAPASAKTAVVSLRLPTERVETMKKEARQKRVSINVLVSQILECHYDFNYYANEAGFVTLPKQTVTSIVESLDNRELQAICRGVTKKDLTDLVYLMKGKLTLQSFLNTFFAWVRESRFAYNDNFEDGHRTVTVHHNMGEKWSIAMKESLSSMFEEINCLAKFEARANSLTFHIYSPGHHSEERELVE